MRRRRNRNLTGGSGTPTYRNGSNSTKSFPLAHKVLSYTATTAEGLKLQTRALISAYNQTWTCSDWEDAEPEDPWLRDFVRSACNVLGIPFPPLPNWRESAEART
jgi:hypothetical protein